MMFVVVMSMSVGHSFVDMFVGMLTGLASFASMRMVVMTVFVRVFVSMGDPFVVVWV
jgi:hypothetical protein